MAGQDSEQQHNTLWAPRLFEGAKRSVAPRRWGRTGKRTYCKQDEVLLVVLADTVIDPGTVVVHLPNTPLTNTERAHKADF